MVKTEIDANDNFWLNNASKTFGDWAAVNHLGWLTGNVPKHHWRTDTTVRIGVSQPMWTRTADSFFKVTACWQDMSTLAAKSYKVCCWLTSGTWSRRAVSGVRRSTDDVAAAEFSYTTSETHFIITVTSNYARQSLTAAIIVDHCASSGSSFQNCFAHSLVQAVTFCAPPTDYCSFFILCTLLAPSRAYTTTISNNQSLKPTTNNCLSIKHSLQLKTFFTSSTAASGIVPWMAGQTTASAVYDTNTADAWYAHTRTTHYRTHVI